MGHQKIKEESGSQHQSDGKHYEVNTSGKGTITRSHKKNLERDVEKVHKKKAEEDQEKKVEVEVDLGVIESEAHFEDISEGKPVTPISD